MEICEREVVCDNPADMCDWCLMLYGSAMVAKELLSNGDLGVLEKTIAALRALVVKRGPQADNDAHKGLTYIALLNLKTADANLAFRNAMSACDCPNCTAARAAESKLN